MELLKHTLKDALEDESKVGAKRVTATHDAPSASPPASPLHAAFLCLASPGAVGRGGALVAARLPRTLPVVLSFAPPAPSFELPLPRCPALSLRAHVLSLADGEWAFSSLRSIADARLARLSRRALRPPPTHSVPTEAASGAAHLHEPRAATLISLALALAIHTHDNTLD